MSSLYFSSAGPCFTYRQIVPGNYYLSLVDKVTCFTIAAAVRLCFTFPSHLFDHAKAFELLTQWMQNWDPYGSYAGNNDQGRSNKRQNTSPASPPEASLPYHFHSYLSSSKGAQSSAKSFPSNSYKAHINFLTLT